MVLETFMALLWYDQFCLYIGYGFKLEASKNF